MFHRIEFRTVSWLRKQSYILRDLKILGIVPACLIHLHDDKELTKIPGHFFKEDIHHFSIGWPMEVLALSFSPEQDTRQRKHRDIPELFVGQLQVVSLSEPSNSVVHLFGQIDPHLEGHTPQDFCPQDHDLQGSHLSSPGVFLKILLGLFPGLYMKRPRNHITPSVAVQEPTDD
jgi:hypothetical protein